MNAHVAEPFRSLLNNLASGVPQSLVVMCDRNKHPDWQGPFTVQEYVGLPGDRIYYCASEQTQGITSPGEKDRTIAEESCTALNAAFLLGVEVGYAKERGRHLTVTQAVSILERSERGRAVGRQLYEFLADRAASLDMDGKAAVLSLLEESFLNRPGTVFDALGVFAES